MIDRGLWIGLSIVLLLATPSLAQQMDARAQDAVDFFGGMCGRVVANWEPPVDHEKYRFAWLSQEDAASLGESLEDLAVWVATAPGSEIHMIHYVTRGDICGVEVETADADSIDQAFESLVRMAAKDLSLEAAVRSDETSDGSRTRIWRLGSSAKGYDIGLWSSPDTDRRPQFIMTMAKAPTDRRGR